MMKKAIYLILACCLVFAGCARNEASEPAAPTENQVAVTEPPVAEVVTEPAPTEPVPEAVTEPAKAIHPLPDMTMENLTDAILSVSLEPGAVYYDEHGALQMKFAVYTYDQYDMVDIASLKVGDTVVRFEGDMVVASLEQTEAGVRINGGQENGGIDLATDDSGIFYEIGYNDIKSWYAVGEVTLPLAENFAGVDNADLDQRDLVLTKDSFLEGQIVNFDFTPHNTTIRVENGKVVELNRRYTP